MLSTLVHPLYAEMSEQWLKWRLTLASGEDFKETYLKKFSLRETEEDFQDRLELTYVPAFAKINLYEIRNAIFQRAIDIIRKGGSPSYVEAVAGQQGGVDLSSTTLSAFLEQDVILELLAMARVGIYVDMPVLQGDTLLDKGTLHPYLYIYPTESIKSWLYGSDQKLQKVLLFQKKYTYDELTGLPLDYIDIYRYMEKTEQGVSVKDYNENDELITQSVLQIPEIPLVIAEISDSLFTDVADYQIAMMQLASSDMIYACKSNFPFYTEQYDARAQQMKQQISVDGTAAAKVGSRVEIETGTRQGRLYPLGTERPGFIHPSPEPLRASMEKQEHMKEEIRQLMMLSLSNIKSKMASSESKTIDNEGLEGGLACLGMVLEATERQIAAIWNMYEGYSGEITITYPKTYSLKSDNERIVEAEKKMKLLVTLPTVEAQRELMKDIVHTLIGHKISQTSLETIYAKIDTLTTLNIDPTILVKDVEAGILDNELCADLRGYPKGTIEKARQDHADRLARISIAQSSMDSRPQGIKDVAPDGTARRDEKTLSQTSTTNPDGGKKVRGKNL